MSENDQRKAPVPAAPPGSFQPVLDAAPALIAVAGLDGYYKYVNRAFERILGYSTEESLSRPFVDFIHPDDRDAARAELARLGSGEPVVNFEDRNVCKDGSFRWISWTVVPQMDRGLVYGIGHDITPRKDAADALHRAEKKWLAVAANAPVFVCLVDREGRFEFINRTTPDLTPGQVLGRPLFEFVNEDDHASIRKALRDVFESGLQVTVQSSRRMEDGQTVWFDALFGPVTIHGKVQCASIVAVDVSRRKRVEDALRKEQRELRDARAELERRVAERTDELSRANQLLRAEREHLREMLLSQERDRRLVASEIHDGLAQQLLGAKMHLELYRHQRRNRPDEAERNLERCLALLLQGVKESRHLIHGLRPPDLDGLGIALAIRQIADDCAEAGLPVDLDSELADDSLPRRVEDTAYRIIQEGLNNARLHSGADRVRLALQQTNGRLHIEIRDEGRGFDPDAVPRSCYGLRGAQQRARVFGGDLTIESRPGEGTRIAAELPVDSGDTEDSLG